MHIQPPRSAAAEPLWPGFPTGVLPPADPLTAGAPPQASSHLSPGWIGTARGEIAALRHVMHRMTALVDPGEAVRAALDVALEVTEANLGSLWLVQPDGSLARAASVGLKQGYLDAFAADPVWQADQQKLCASPGVVITGLETARMREVVLPLLGSRALVVMPLRARGMRAGALVLCHPQEAWFGGFSTDYLLGVGELLAAALDDARRLEELRASNDLHAGLLQAAQDAICCVDSEGRITEVNSALERLLGATREVLIGKRYDAFTAPQQVESLREAVTLLFREGVPIVGFQKGCVTASGAVVPSTLHATRYTDSQGEVRVVAVLRDERTRLAAEQHARETQALFALMLANLDAGVALLRANGLEILEHNTAFVRLIHAAGPADAVDPDGARILAGRGLAALLPGLAKRELGEAIRRAIETGAPVRLAETPAPHEGEEARWWSVAIAPLAIRAGAPCDRLVLTISDVSERHELEDRYRHAQKMEAIGTLAGGFAHEFNNLLTAIMGNVSLSLLDLPPGHGVVPGLRDAEAASQRAADLTRQLLGFSRRSPMHAVPCDLGKAVRDGLALIDRTFDPRIVIDCEVAEDLWRVRADIAQVTQVLVNLAVNARDAMPQGGRLRLALRNVCAMPLKPRARMDVVLFEVSDTGDGMEPDVLARMYEPFFTTKGPDRGTGLGLSVVHGIVEQHGGWIECESRAGKGTTFRVFLPRFDAVAGLRGPSGRGERVLVVDDEPALRGLARSVLERQGYRVEVAADGVEALERLRKGLQVDLVLLDQTMPRLSGLQTLAVLRQEAPGLAVALTSGFEPGSGPETGPPGMQADAFLLKPYAPDSLGAFVREVLDSRG